MIIATKDLTLNTDNVVEFRIYKMEDGSYNVLYSTITNSSCINTIVSCPTYDAAKKCLKKINKGFKDNVNYLYLDALNTRRINNG